MAAQNDIIPDDSTAFPQVGSVLGGRFLLKEVVARPSIGIVYKALDRAVADGQPGTTQVAVRVLPPELAKQEAGVRMLQREVARIRCLAHPYIARFIDFDHDGGRYYLAVEWLEGRTLASILDSGEARHIDRVYAFRIVRQLGEALDYAHRCGIVHGGVDPANVMIMPNGDARLFDFGLAISRNRILAARSASGESVSGVMAYSSLQVLNGETPVTSDDIFSLACLLYRLVAGHRVFGPRNAADAHQAKMMPERPHGFTDAQWIEMRRALSYSRDSRYHYVRKFVTALDDGTTAQLSDAIEKKPATAVLSRSHRWIIGAVTGLAMVAGVTVMPGSVEPAADRVAAPVTKESPELSMPVDEPMLVDEPLPIETSVAINSRETSTSIMPEFVEEPRTEPALPLNAVGFSADRVFVEESDLAVQIDVMRFNADDQSLSIRYSVEGLSATEGDDYFVPDSSLLSFGPRQRTVRLLVPIVQDSVVEGAERFTLRLANTAEVPSVYGYQQVLVTIRDDDPQAR